MIYDDLSYPVQGSRFLGEGILTTNKIDSHIQRKEFDRSFMKKQLDSFEDFMRHETVLEIERLSNTVDIKEMCKRIALNIVGKSLFGDTLNEDMTQYITDEVYYINQEVLQYLSPIYRFTKYIPNYAYRMIDKTKKIRKTMKLALDKRKKSDFKYEDLLDIIIDSSINDDDIIIDNMLTFFLAGYDTSSSALTFCLQLIHNPVNNDILIKLIKEIENTDIIDDMIYLDCVIKETLRLYPPAVSVLRKYDLSCNAYFNDTNWESNLNLIIPIYSIHRNPRYWENPDSFIPERWLSLKESEVSDIYMPFSSGSRNCIGKYFALREMKVVLSTILNTIEFNNMSENIDTVVNPILINSYSVTAKFVKK
jgi:cytochrome P450